MTTVEMLLAEKEPSAINKTSLGNAALTAGIGLLIMAIAAPFAELYVYPQLVNPEGVYVLWRIDLHVMAAHQGRPDSAIRPKA